MKRSFIIAVTLFISLCFFSACNSSSSSGTTSGGDTGTPTGEDIPKLTTTKTLSTTKQTAVKVAGEGNDLLELTIPKLPFGETEDMPVEFKLVYNGTNPLPVISINKDIEFDSAVTLTFRSDNLTDNSYVFVFHGATKDYLVPVVKTGSTYTAKLLHFSNYGFEESPAVSALQTDIETDLTELASYSGDGGLFALDKDLIRDIFAKIQELERLDPTIEHDYTVALIQLIDHEVDKWLTKMEGSSVTYWDGYCVHADFKTFISQLSQTMVEVELIGATDISTRVNAEISKRIKAAIAEWSAMTPPQACDTTNIAKYIKCGSQLDTEADLAGVSVSTDIMAIIKSTMDMNNVYILANASCSTINCLRYYLSIQGEMELMGLSNRTQAMQELLTELEASEEAGACGITGTWYGCGGEGCYTITFSSGNTVTQSVVSYGQTTVTNGNWRIVDHPAGGTSNGIEMAGMSVEGYTLGTYYFRIESNGTLSNYPATPSVVLAKQ